MALWALFGVMTTAALILAPDPAPAWRWLAVLSVLGLGWAPSLAVLLGRGPHAIRAFEWGTDGVWHLTLPDGSIQPGRLTHATATLGPWVLLAWSTPGNRGSRRRYALIEESGQTGPATVRALKARLKLQSTRRASVSGAVVS